MAEIERLLLSDDDLEHRSTVFSCSALSGRVAVITGGGSGIGRATAWLYARMGAKIVVCGRDPEKLSRIENAFRARNRDIAVFSGNIRDPDTGPKLLAFAAERYGQVDILVNSAGGQYPQASIDFTAKGWNAVIETNLTGTWYLMQAAARHWREQGRAGIILNVVASVHRGMPGGAHTCAARAGVIYLSRTVAVEWAPYRIRVNCIAPGTIASEGMMRYDAAARATFAGANPMFRVGDAWEIAETAAYLAADSGAYITGEIITVDGGAQAWGDLWTIPKPAYFTPGAEPQPPE